MIEESDEKSYVSIKIDEYYQLIASKVVLDVLNKSINSLKVNHSKPENKSIDLNSIDITLRNEEFCENKKSDAWNISFSYDFKAKNSEINNQFNVNNMLNSNLFLRRKKYINKKRW
jgi:hypothetical protein